MTEHIPSPVHIGRDNVALLINEARTKPVIAALVARAAEMTDEEYAAVTTPLPWQKKALGDLRHRKAQEASLARAEVFVDTLGGFTETKPLRGVVVRHTGLETTVMPPARAGRGMGIVVKTGDILFVTKDETWHGSLAIGHPAIRVEVIQADASREDYFRHYEREAPSMDMRGAAPQLGEMHESGLFRIMR